MNQDTLFRAVSPPDLSALKDSASRTSGSRHYGRCGRSFETASLPVGAVRGHEALEFSVSSLDAGELRDPFFVDTLTRLPDLDIETVCIAREILSQPVEMADETAPAGLIFHVSRCGSTLLANLLRQMKGCVVYSEPLAFNDLLMPPWGDWTEREVVSSLRLAAKRLSHAAAGQRYFLKLRSWNTLYAGVVRKAFPYTPWVFLVRDPIEVAVSVLRKPPTWLRAFPSSSNPFLPFLDPTMPRAATREEYVGQVLGAFAHSIRQLEQKQNGRLAHYSALPGAAWESIAKHFDLSPDPDDVAHMRVEARLYSKDQTRQTQFIEDAVAKQTSASNFLRQSLERYCTPHFTTLVETWNHP